MGLALVLLVLGLASFILSFLWRFQSTVPPGPFSFPIVGALFSLKQPLHRHFANISKKYGPLIYLKIGMAPFLVVNSSEMAAQIFKAHDLEFGDRPSDEFFRLISHNFNDLVLAPIDERWKRMRRICSTHLFSSSMLKVSARFRQSEMKEALGSIYQQSGTEMNLGDIFGQLIINSLSLTLFSEKGLKLVDLIRELAALNLNLNVGTLFPALDRFDLHGIYRKMSTDLMPRLTNHLESQFEKHLIRKEQAGESFVPRDFTDVLISLKEDELSDTCKMALVSDMVLAGLETQAITIEWTMAELINRPDVMVKAQEEIDRVVGKDRIVQEEDLPNLPYIEALLKESLRVHPPTPLGFPRRNPKPVKLHGWTIPANCKVLTNMWAIGHDPAHWSEPEKFQPERFLGSKIPVNGQCFNFIPFSSGRRVCAGYPLAMRSVSYFVAGLVQAFDWKCGKNGINMQENTTSVTLKMYSDLIAVASPRVDAAIH